MQATILEKAKKNPVVYFFFKLFIFFIIVFVLDFITGSVLRHYYFKQKTGVLYRTTYSVDSTTADLLIFGSSRATHHYNPDVFEEGLNLSYYNAGKDGNFMFYHYAILKGILKRYIPKTIILDFINGEFRITSDSYDRISAILPYASTHPEMREIINIKSPYENIKLMSQVYPYNSLVMSILGGSSDLNKKGEKEYKGYIPLNREWNEPPVNDVEDTFYKVDSFKTRAFRSFVTDCVHADIKLYIVCSPYFKKTVNSDYSVVLAKEIAKQYHVPVFDLSADADFISNSRLFSDPLHLNDMGARIFSKRVVDSIKTVK